MKKIYFHIGYSKTATSFLQESVFSKNNNIFYLGKHSDNKTETPDKFKHFNDLFVNFFFSKLSGNHDKKVHLIGNELINLIQDVQKPILISYEELQDRDSEMVNKKKKWNTNTDLNILKLKTLKSHIEQSIPQTEFHIICTIRKQDDFLLSIYSSQFSAFEKCRYNFQEISTFDKFLEYGFLNPEDDWFGSLFYFDEIQKYITAFGKDKITVIPYEIMLEENKKYVELILKSMGITAPDDIDYSFRNKQRTSGNLYPLRENHRFYSPILIIDQFVKIKNLYSQKQFGFNNTHIFRLIERFSSFIHKKKYVHLSQEQRDQINNLYRANNSLLDKEFSLNLKKYGYALEQE